MALLARIWHLMFLKKINQDFRQKTGWKKINFTHIKNNIRLIGKRTNLLESRESKV